MQLKGIKIEYRHLCKKAHIPIGICNFLNFSSFNVKKKRIKGNVLLQVSVNYTFTVLLHFTYYCEL